MERKTGVIRRILQVTWLALVAAVLLGGGLVRTGAAPQQQVLPDLVAELPDSSGLSWDAQELTASGDVRLNFRNRGPGDAKGFSWRLFTDWDGNGRFDLGLDHEVAAATHPGLLAGQRASISISLNAGTAMPFRQSPLHFELDPEQQLAEGSEANNDVHSGLACRPPARQYLDLAEEWAWEGAPDDRGCAQVMQAPAIGDLDGDAIPEIVFTSFCHDDFEGDGRLHALRGDGKGSLWTIGGAALATRASTSPAIGDLDGDGQPEVVAAGSDGASIIAFEGDGRLRWRSALPENSVRGGGITLADLDGKPPVEVIAGGGVFGSDGRLLWHVRPGTGFGRGGPQFQRTAFLHPVAADLDRNGRQEVLAGPTLYDSGGTIIWNRADLPDGYVAVADMNLDRVPEIVLVGNQQLWLLRPDGSKVWGPVALPLAPGRDFVSGGPPAVADFDGDGGPEIAVSAGTGIALIDADGGQLWTRPLQDLSSISGVTAFDVDADGAAEILTGDELQLRIFDGRDGALRWSVASPSATHTELPVVADVDGDGEAEIVKAANDFRYDGPTGIRVYGSEGRPLPSTRPIWNQHAYSIDNVGDLGGIPSQPAPGWLDHNTFRANPAEATSIALPDLTAGRIESRALGADRFEIQARIGNAGGTAVPAGTAIGFYREGSSGSEVSIGRTRLATSLDPGRWIDVKIELRSSGPAERIIVRADDEGGARGQVEECDETNNRHERVMPLIPEPPDEATPTPSAGDCVCELVRQRVPPALISLALAEPQRFAGWGLPLDPNKPPGPNNPPRVCLQLAHPSLDFHPLYNRPLWQVGCP